MKIILLEDENDKTEAIKNEILTVVPRADIKCVGNWLDYSRQVIDTKFDLILLDLLVPRSGKSQEIEDHHTQLVETTRDYGSKSFYTPAVVLSRHLDDPGEFVFDLNKVDITVISYDDEGLWKDSLRRKVLTAKPPQHFDFLIICALEKEVAAYEDLVDYIGKTEVISDLVCREISLGTYSGVIVLAYRMGLVATAVTASLAIERFKPSLVCMSGICGGIPKSAEIYDVLVTDVCHQHDSGKWSDGGFKSEHYDVQIDPSVRAKLIEVISHDLFVSNILAEVRHNKSEIPDDKELLNCRVRVESTSSGSAVIAEEGKTELLSVGQRKLAGFEMEIYSLYEAARHATIRPLFFAAKTVVDDGGRNKGDKFHRIGCILSAKVIIKIIESDLIHLHFSRSN